MLVIGDKAMSDHINFVPSGDIEIICDIAQIKKVVDEFRLPNVYINANGVRTYRINGGKNKAKVVSHRCNKGIEYLFDSNMGQSKTVRNANLFGLAFVANNKSSVRHNNIKEWEKHARIYSKFMNTTWRKLPTKIREEFKTYSRLLMPYTIASENIQLRPYKYKDYKYFEKYDLLKLVSRMSVPIYATIVKSTNEDNYDNLDFNMWCKLAFQYKLGCALERIYLDTLNEYIVDEVVEGRDIEENVITMLKRSIMNIASQRGTSSWFGDWVRVHYDQIIDSIDLEFYEEFRRSYQMNLIQKIK